MNTKLTLRLSSELIRRAKRHSLRRGKSLSQLVADYFALIGAADEQEGGALPDPVRALYGTFAGASGDQVSHRRHLEKKHR